MSEPSLALQKAIVAALRADSAVVALIGQRSYDRVPPNPTFPYVSLGSDQVLPDHAECLNGSVDVTAAIDVWSRVVGKVEAKLITGAIVSLLNLSESLTLTGYRVVSIEHEESIHLDDPDGLTAHSVITFRALIDEE